MAWRHAIAALALLSACSMIERSPERVDVMTSVSRFSSGEPGETLPPGWRAWTVGKYKKATEYTLVKEDGRTVIRASANASASGLSQDVRVDTREFPLLRWRWKVPELIAGADNTRQHSEDSPVRMIVTFQGDYSRWSFEDRLFATQMKLLTGYDMPYATLMYIWENRAPVSTVIANQHTTRVKMIVAESGHDRLGEWREVVRDVHEDYKRAFGEEPPLTRSVGIMTDTDNTGEKVYAYYGDISFQRAARP
jgi:Protein of unknown function (DUF3047)